MVSALACALPGSDVVDFRRRFAQVQISAHDAAQCGHTRKMEAICFLHAGPPAQAETPRVIVRCEVILGNTLRHFDSSGWRSNQWVFSPFDYYKSTLTA
jgi:hypothetical protein